MSKGMQLIGKMTFLPAGNWEIVQHYEPIPVIAHAHSGPSVTLIEQLDVVSELAFIEVIDLLKDAEKRKGQP